VQNILSLFKKLSQFVELPSDTFLRYIKLIRLVIGQFIGPVNHEEHKEHKGELKLCMCVQLYMGLWFLGVQNLMEVIKGHVG
jgi:hypothetical protein